MIDVSVAVIEFLVIWVIVGVISFLVIWLIIIGGRFNARLDALEEAAEKSATAEVLP